MELILSQNLLFPLSHFILASAAQGFGGSILLFALCFLGVHIAKVSVRGWRLYNGTQDNKTPDKTPEKTPEPKPENKTTAPEAIYYIVEKKRRRSKPSYGDPKEIRFK